MPYHNDQAARQAVAAALSALLADTYVLYLKTHGFHWNVVGPRFYELHKLFEDQYTELHDAGDEIAERIRALGVKAPSSYAEFGKLSAIAEEPGAPAADAMIRQLLDGNRHAARTAQAAADAADAAADIASADLATVRVTAHEKAAWMLESLLQA